MGQTFGYMPDNGINLYLHPDVTPHPHKEPSADPNYGFPNGRKERVMHATLAELESAKIEPKDRDYCAHHLLKFRACRKDNWPFAVNCEHEKHVYLNCQYEDFVLRMKEFEREKRLMVRAKKQGVSVQELTA